MCKWSVTQYHLFVSKPNNFVSFCFYLKINIKKLSKRWQMTSLFPWVSYLQSSLNQGSCTTMVTITRTPREPVSLAFSSTLPSSHTSSSSDYAALYHWPCLVMIKSPFVNSHCSCQLWHPPWLSARSSPFDLPDPPLGRR